MEYIVKKISGRFKHFDKPKLEMMKFCMIAIIRSWGGIPHDMRIIHEDDLPLWAEVEFLDNIIQFEMENNPYLAVENPPN